MNKVDTREARKRANNQEGEHDLPFFFSLFCLAINTPKTHNLAYSSKRMEKCAWVWALCTGMLREGGEVYMFHMFICI